ncbi:MAG TPA: 3-oxoacyl-[acyl-carrier-protein] synthase III C-terminal domain-containing protein [Polyangiaceae bacterium]|nr:3-oxoacyl-[acyl-carrier-protein] synthase III C-terminal domain-containing protein [Polyangiaceae bacterium]
MSRIESVATAASRRRLFPRGALRLADDAIERCLASVNRTASELDLLVNAGVYRDDNLAEPALAAMIQEDVGANPGHPPRERSHGTFSFDVVNGGAGAVTAVELVDGLIASKTVELGVVVASDSNPGNVEHFPFPAAGGAVLLGPSAPGAGFLAFDSETFPEFSASYESALVWRPSHHLFGLREGGSNVLELEIREDFAAHAVTSAEAALGRFLGSHGLAARDVDLLVASTYPRNFASDLARRLGISPDAVSVPEEPFEGAHTAGILASLEPAFRSRRLASAKNVLFVGVGAGITVATALYRHPR